MKRDYKLPSLDLPDATPAMSLCNLVQDKLFSERAAFIPLALGYLNPSTPYFYHLGRQGHLVISSDKQEEKHSALHSALLSLLCSYSPDELILLLAGPADSELHFYQRLPHLVCPITDKASQLLRWVTHEIERRHELFASRKVKNISDFNATAAEDEKLPLIITVIDEHPDLSKAAAPELTETLKRLASAEQSLGQAGVYTIISTNSCRSHQLFKSLGVACILKCAHDEKQDENRALLLTIKASPGHATALHLPRVSRADITATVEHCAAQVPEEELISPPEPEPTLLSADDEKLYEKCVNLVRSKQKASTAMLQRHLSIGYGRAAKMMDVMEERGIIAPATEAPSSCRAVLPPAK